MISRPRPWIALAAALLLLGLATTPAHASPATLKRSIENLVLSPFDILMSPIVAGKTVYNNLRDIDDSTAVRIVYPLPGWAWVTMVQAGAGALRCVTGALELVPGIVLLPFDADLQPLFDPADENEALVDYELPFFHVRFGIDYTTAAY